MATSKNNQDEAREKEMRELKAEADELGVEYTNRIGFENLEKKVKEARKEREKLKLKKPKKLSDKEVAKLKATSLSKVRIVNLDKDNTGATTVFAGVHNMHIDLARVIPLNMDIALEEALIRDIENRKMLVGEPVIDKRGEKTGNFKMVEAPMYAVKRY